MRPESDYSVGYREYLHSPEWQAVRAAKLLAAGARCQGCGETERLEVHHLTYDRLGHEHPNDLQVLCHWCHMLEHNLPVRDSPVVKLPDKGDVLAGQQVIAARLEHIKLLREFLANAEAMRVRFQPRRLAAPESKRGRIYQLLRRIERDIHACIRIVFDEIDSVSSPPCADSELDRHDPSRC